MKDIKKIKKKLNSKVDKIISNCEKGKYKIIPVNELVEILSLSKEINNVDQIQYLYDNYKKYIPGELLLEIKRLLGIEEIKKAKTVEIVPNVTESTIQDANISIIPIVFSIDNFENMTYEDLPEETKKSLEQYKKEGFIFKIAKTHTKFDIESDRKRNLLSEIDLKYERNVSICWKNNTELRITMHSATEQMTVLEAVKKFKDDHIFMMHLNYLLGLSLYTPGEAYFENNIGTNGFNNENEKIKIKKYNN